jgi:hypothetical protein
VVFRAKKIESSFLIIAPAQEKERSQDCGLNGE